MSPLNASLGDRLLNGHERATRPLSQLHPAASARRGPRLSLQLWKVSSLTKQLHAVHSRFFFPPLLSD